MIDNDREGRNIFRSILNTLMFTFHYKNKDFCRIVKPSEKYKILEFNQCMKSDKMPYIIYADIESLYRKLDVCASDPENSSTTEIGKHIPCGYSMSTI